MPTYTSTYPSLASSVFSLAASTTSYSTYNDPEDLGLPNYEEALGQPRHIEHGAVLQSPSRPITNQSSRSRNFLSRAVSSTSSSTTSSSLSTSTSDADSDSDSISSSSSSLTTSASTPTLINPSPPLSLIFDRNSVVSATLYSRTGPKYRISTNITVTRTDLYELSQDASGPGTSVSQTMVASVKRRDFLPNVVVFKHRKGRAIRLNEWLRRDKNGRPGRSPSAELTTLDGHYTWIANSTHRLALYARKGSHTTMPFHAVSPIDQQPIAYSKTVDSPPTLALVLRDCDCSDDTKIEIIMSFLVMENKLRQKEKQEDGRGSSMMHALGAHMRLGSVG
ncbi:hypothetical protein CPC08DRAFT_769557 [Agrocybe pediades]|nr:hypothetical protein CPC08DRAFT_769557 [Agrocybe pediades]